MSSTRWPHRLRIYDTATGAVSPGGYTDDDGVWHDDPAVPDTIDLYDGEADVQDGGAMFNRDTNGAVVDQSDAVAFLRRTKDIGSFANKTTLKAEITWEDDTTSQADVVKIRRLDGTVWLKRIF